MSFQARTAWCSIQQVFVTINGNKQQYLPAALMRIETFTAEHAAECECAPQTSARSLIDQFDKQNLLVVVDFLELDLDDLAAAGRHVLADISGLDG